MRILPVLIAAMTAAGGGAELVGAATLTPRQIYEETAPGVVYIDGHEDTGKGSAGTGFILHRDGLVITNAHVVINADTGKPYSRLVIVFKPHRVTGNADEDYANRTTAKLLSADRQLDLALLKIAPAGTPLTVLELQDPRSVGIGDWVAAIGHPESGGLWTLTTGVVSAEFDDFDKTKGKHVFQTEIGLNRGNSGGPLLDVDGRVIGINTAIARLAKDGFPITSISFSVKSDVIQHWMNGLGYSIAAVAVPDSQKPELSSDTRTKSRRTLQRTPRWNPKQTPRRTRHKLLACRRPRRSHFEPKSVPTVRKRQRIDSGAWNKTWKTWRRRWSVPFVQDLDRSRYRSSVAREDRQSD